MMAKKEADVMAMAAAATRPNDTATAKLGDTVIYRQAEHHEAYNGAMEHPAIVTRVCLHGTVNLTVFPDMGVPFSAGSVPHAVAPSRHQLGPYWTEKD